MKNYTTRITRMAIVPEGEPIFSENATNISIEDEAGGEFVAIQQYQDYREPKDQRIAINPEEWPVIKATIDRMVDEVLKEES